MVNSSHSAAGLSGSKTLIFNPGAMLPHSLLRDRSRGDDIHGEKEKQLGSLAVFRPPVVPPISPHTHLINDSST